MSKNIYSDEENALVKQAIDAEIERCEGEYNALLQLFNEDVQKGNVVEAVANSSSLVRAEHELRIYKRLLASSEFYEKEIRLAVDIQMNTMAEDVMKGIHGYNINSQFPFRNEVERQKLMIARIVWAKLGNIRGEANRVFDVGRGKR